MSTDGRGRERVRLLCRRLLYIQGLWWDPPQPDLEFYQELFGPRFARLLYHSRPLRLTHRLLRNVYIAFAIVTLSVQIFYLFPTGIYEFWANKKDVINNGFALIVCLVVYSGLLTFVLNKDSWFRTYRQLDVLADPENFDNDYQREVMQRAHAVCHQLTKYLHVTVVPFVALAVVVLGFTYLLPKRKFIIREWYPIQAELSPYFELITAWRMIELILFNGSGITMISIITCYIIYVRALFLVVMDKAKNTRTRAIETVREKHRRDPLLQPATTIPTRSCLVRYVKGKLPPRAKPNPERGHPLRPTCSILQSGAPLRIKKVAVEEKALRRVDYLTELLKKTEVIKRRRKRMTRSEFSEEEVKEIDTLTKNYLCEVIYMHSSLLWLRRSGRMRSCSSSSLWRSCVLFFMHNLTVTLQSRQVGEALYNSEWIAAPESFKKSVLIIMIRTTRAVLIKPTGLEALSLPLFADVMVRAYKLLSTFNSYLHGVEL